MKSQAQLYKSLPDGRVACLLCRHGCVLSPKERGICGVREAGADGTLLTLVDNGIAACHVDPVEKKPLYHYLPGSTAFSFGTEGCNMDCAWCQNSDISRAPVEHGVVRSHPTNPEELLHAAVEAGCHSVAFTYTEPTVFFELMLKTAEKATAQGLGTIMISNGYQSPACLDALANNIQAANIDLKAFKNSTYQRWCGAKLDGVLDNLCRMKKMGWWLEITTLIVPGINDDPSELRDIARFIHQELGAETPWHLSAFRPCRHLTDRPHTPVSTLLSAVDIGAEEGLHFLYVGNVPHSRHTLCPACGQELIKRDGFAATALAHFEGKCLKCGHPIPGIWRP